MAREDTSQALIDELVSDLKPVRPLAHPLLRMAVWTSLCLLYAAIAVYAIGLRPDIPARLQSTAFVFEQGLVGLLFVTATLASFVLCIPDQRGQSWVLGVVWGFCAAFGLLVLSRMLTESFHMPHLHWDECFNKAIILVTVPAFVMAFMMRRGTTTMPLTQAVMNTLSLAALGFIGLRLTCTIETLGHGVFLHLLPFLVLGLGLGILARRIYNW